MSYVILILMSIGGGVVVGGAYAAFIALIEIFPRVIQLTETNRYLKLYEDMYILGGFLASFVYFYDFSIKLGKISTLPIGFILGAYIGLFSSALAETLNVIPIMAQKFKLNRKENAIKRALLMGKVAGSLYYFLIHIGG
ncbi:stage V sporulation protein AB [Paratissierella segnis]|uniref:Stage V sporulation protein AB n=1 Tax=Paratissierella segnis TaxID=2763679 RepID=A0A926ET78_9FIRM|nr:stage V sporulation protein AB [Paratissierella segnis]MBC8587027.1 stage V sporulation protein AB [Paratissierella segnis]